jgi:hypothetical protein
VDYYLLLTGDLERTVMQDLTAEDTVVEFFKLLSPRWVVSCVDCYAKADTIMELERLFSGRPETMSPGEERG